MWRLEPVFFGAVCFRVVYSQVKRRIVRHQSCFPVTFHGKFCTPSQDLVHHQLKTFSGKLQTLFLSVDHSKLQIFVTLWVLTLLYIPPAQIPVLLTTTHSKKCCSVKQYSTDSPEETPSILFSYSISISSSVIATAALSLSPRLAFFSSYCLACNIF